MKVLYTKNYKRFLIEILKYLNKWRNIPYPWIGRVNITQIPIFPTFLLRLSNPNLNPSGIFIEISNLIQNLHGHPQHLDSEHNLEKYKIQLEYVQHLISELL